VPPGDQIGRRDDGHVHSQGERGLGRAGDRAGEGRVRDHRFLADQYRGEGSLHIKEKSAAKSTIFLVCRPREIPAENADAVYWEEVEPRSPPPSASGWVSFKQRDRRRGSVSRLLRPGVAGLQRKLALRRGRAIQKPRELALFPDEDFDPYAVWPEDALNAARGEVKRWRMEQLATVKRQHHLDPLTEWYVLAWDAFKAPGSPSTRL